jgi:uncharacterized protein (DUF1501 family)
MLSRRDFLRRSSLIALAPTVPAFIARTALAAGAERHRRVLVVVQLDGGNDGINTVVPHSDEGYLKHRKSLRLRKEDLVKVNEQLGLNPALRDLGKLLEAGQLGIVQGVGYPNPSRSHFESMAVWHTARLDPKEHAGPGWIGLGMDGNKKAATPSMVFVGGGPMPPALRSRRSVASALTRPEDFVLAQEAKYALSPGAETKDDLAAFVHRMADEGHATAERMKGVVAGKDEGPAYPNQELAQQLRLVARLIKADVGTRVFYTRQAGYDTHAAQYGTHFQLLSNLASGLKAFHDDLKAAKLDERVCVLAFSEFGRTVKENGSAGTDHGTSGPVFLTGAGVKGGVHGATPSLLDLDPKHGDLRTSVDFRRVYATLLESWLGLPAEAVVGKGMEPMPLFRA